MKYQIKMMSGDKYLITEEEFKKFSTLKEKGLVFIPSVGGLINISSIETVIAENMIDKSNLKEGYLHDGTKVIKKFGSWVMPDKPDLRLDPHYYPEIITDDIFINNPREDVKRIEQKSKTIRS